MSDETSARESRAEPSCYPYHYTSFREITAEEVRGILPSERISDIDSILKARSRDTPRVARLLWDQISWAGDDDLQQLAFRYVLARYRQMIPDDDAYQIDTDIDQQAILLTNFQKLVTVVRRITFGTVNSNNVLDLLWQYLKAGSPEEAATRLHLVLERTDFARFANYVDHQLTDAEISSLTRGDCYQRLSDEVTIVARGHGTMVQKATTFLAILQGTDPATQAMLLTHALRLTEEEGTAKAVERMETRKKSDLEATVLFDQVELGSPVMAESTRADLVSDPIFWSLFAALLSRVSHGSGAPHNCRDFSLSKTPFDNLFSRLEGS